MKKYPRFFASLLIRIRPNVFKLNQTVVLAVTLLVIKVINVAQQPVFTSPLSLSQVDH